MNAVPHRCPRCCEEMVETDEGTAQGFYGRLVFARDVPPHLCRNCDTVLVPVDKYVSTEGLTDRLGS